MDMARYLNKSSNGNFIVGDHTYVGTLTHSDAGSTLSIHVPGFVSELAGYEYQLPIFGTLFDFTAVTLLNTMITENQGYVKAIAGGSYDRSQQFSFALWYVIFSENPVDTRDYLFDALDFSIPNANDLFHSESFNYISNATETVAKDLVRKDLEYLQLPGLLDNYQFGESPAIFLYTGASVLAELSLPFGNLKIRNNPSYSTPSNSGFALENNISCHVDFAEPTDFWQATSKIEPIKQLLELILGKPQSLKNFKLVTKDGDNLPSIFEVYRSVYNQPERSSAYVHASERLIHIEIELDEFQAVLNEWLLRQEEWKFSRKEFFSVLSDVKYSFDTLVKLSNLFDLIPSSAYSDTSIDLSDDLLAAKVACKSIFKALPHSVERESMLNALGRLGNKSLKHKIKDRYKVIQDSGLIELDKIDLVINQCVDCRNFFVHGGKKNFDYSDQFDLMCFFIDTLMFIYGISEMIECGWNRNNWTDDQINSHPYSLYLVSYEFHLNILVEVLKPEQSRTYKT